MVIDCCCMGGETSDDGGRKPVVGVQKRPQPSEEQERRIWKNTIKVLLLGTGESGKTTFLKQMVILHGRGEFTIDKIREYRSQIHQNIVEGMREVLAVHKKLQLSFELQASQQLAAKFNGILADGSFVRSLDMLKFCEISPTIERLWTDSSVVTAFDRRHAFQVNDSCRYFFEHIVRIAQPDYVPTNRDILYCRKATQKITDETFVIQGTPFRFFDVGGQRAQRQKWFMCFEGMITSILFMVASSEFDQRLREDRRRNRIVEALELFRTIADYQLFDKVSIILFLNKADLLREKIRQRGPDAPTFGDYFPDFTGDSHSLEAVQSYLVGKFKNVRNREPPVRQQWPERVQPRPTRTWSSSGSQQSVAVVREPLRDDDDGLLPEERMSSTTTDSGVQSTSMDLLGDLGVKEEEGLQTDLRGDLGGPSAVKVEEELLVVLDDAASENEDLMLIDCAEEQEVREGKTKKDDGADLLLEVEEDLISF